MDNENQEESVRVATELTNTPPRHFSNVVRVSTTINDISLLFGNVYPVGLQSDDNQGQGVCLVQMSPEAAKSRYLLLRYQLLRYEQRGETTIPVHPDMSSKYGEDQ